MVQIECAHAYAQGFFSVKGILKLLNCISFFNSLTIKKIRIFLHLICIGLIEISVIINKQKFRWIIYFSKNSAVYDICFFCYKTKRGNYCIIYVGIFYMRNYHSRMPCYLNQHIHLGYDPQNVVLSGLLHLYFDEMSRNITTKANDVA